MKSGVSLQQMLTEVKRQSESKEDYLIAPNRLRMESYGKEMFLHLSDDSGTELIEPMTITGIAHRQIGTHLRIPAAYYDRMREERPDLLAYNANTWFKQENSQRTCRSNCNWISRCVNCCINRIPRQIRIDHRCIRAFRSGIRLIVYPQNIVLTSSVGSFGIHSTGMLIIAPRPFKLVIIIQ